MSKAIIFCEIIFGQLLKTFGIFSGHTVAHKCWTKLKLLCSGKATSFIFNIEHPSLTYHQYSITYQTFNRPFVYWGNCDMSQNFINQLRRFFKWTKPGLFSVYFWFFQINITIITTIYCEKCPSRIRCWDLNPRPIVCESPPILTRPGLLLTSK